MRIERRGADIRVSGLVTQFRSALVVSSFDRFIFFDREPFDLLFDLSEIKKILCIF
jgi:hypothetical protein